MKALASGDRDAFYEQERGFRERAATPPFGRLAAVILSGEEGEKVRDIGRLLAKTAPPARGVRALTSGLRRCNTSKLH